MTYTFPDFTYTLYTVTYELLLDDGGSTDATTTHASWLSLSGTTITINTSTASDAGEYNLLIRGTLDDSTNYPGDQTTDEVSITIWLMELSTAT